MVSVSRKTAFLGLFLVVCLSILLCASAASSTANLKAQAKVQATGWEVTLERQKLRAQALADELGSLIEYAARKVLGSHYTNVYSSWTSFRWRFAPYLSQARLHVFTAIKYIGHLTAKLEATILDLVTANKSSLGNYADHATNHASTLAKVIVGFGAIVIVAFLNSLLGRRRRV
ncbi:TPA: hypothetical protein ACH3X2_006279 [Trebouxia sp. C0005]